MGQIVDAAGTGTAELIEKFIQGLVFVLAYVLVMILYGVLKNILIGKSRESLKSALFKATLSAPTSDYSGTNTAEYINDLTNNLSIFQPVGRRLLVHGSDDAFSGAYYADDDSYGNDDQKKKGKIPK